MNDNNSPDENNVWRIDKTPNLLHRCFISEQLCVEERKICKYWEERQSGKNTPQAFVVMAFNFRNNMLYERQIKPMLANLDEPLLPCRADTLIRTGYIVCRKVCQPILESDLVVVELTILNKNVTYELGLSLALERKILLMVQEQEPEEKIDLSNDVNNLFRRLDIKESELFRYKPFGFITTSAQELQNSLWKGADKELRQTDSLQCRIGVLGADHLVPLSTSNIDFQIPLPNSNIETQPKSQLTDALRCHLGNVIRDAVCNILGYESEKEYEEYLKSRGNSKQKKEDKVDVDKCKERNDFLGNYTATQGKKFSDISAQEYNKKKYYPWMHLQSMRTDKKSFTEIVDFIDSRECLAIDLTKTGNNLNDAINLFWLGYAHGKGKTVIPVYAYSSDKEQAELGHSNFDVQGLYFLGYDIRNPKAIDDDLMAMFKDILESTETERSRNKLWKPIFEGADLQISVGATVHKGSEKYSLIEWDHMVLAELHSFISEKRSTLHYKISYPTYQQPDTVNKKLIEGVCLDKFLQGKIEKQNVIIIGSPDVNIITELVLAKAKGIAPFSPEKITKESQKFFEGLVSVKSNNNNTRGIRYYYKDSKDKEEDKYESSYNYRFLDKPDNSEQSDDKVVSSNQYTFFQNEDEDEDEDKDKEEKEKEKKGEKAKKDKGSTGFTKFHRSYGHIAIFENPYSEGKRIIVLSGISGPATLALAQMLTGCINEETNYQLQYRVDKEKIKVDERKIHILGGVAENENENENDKSKTESFIADLFYEHQDQEDLRSIFKGVKEDNKTEEVKKKIKYETDSGKQKGYRPLKIDLSKKSLEMLEKINTEITEGYKQQTKNKKQTNNNFMVEAVVEVLLTENVEHEDKNTVIHWQDPRKVVAWRFAKDPFRTKTPLKDISSDLHFPKSEKQQ
ncbi:hypothetical protein Ping_0257 [Psychromonas ingrahamii 37]|uniref:Uncharacterized protein n=1 Tax=Psychromonas ingrahamii (strain DSM 17664 / CCUG 51855 / 37) TaxID=357804 RepID=A1SRK9_PSYIN|nr:hypothetical protein [Psychromonas ingrahamii]ABM02124.1 hypothetical protein Ping_0257 [Psychromonas ingrahamii 37]